MSAAGTRAIPAMHISRLLESSLSRASPLRLPHSRLPFCQYSKLPQSHPRWFHESSRRAEKARNDATSETSSTTENTSASRKSSQKESAGGKFNLYGDDWEDTADYAIKSFDDLPHRLFGANQHMIINYELKEALRIMLRQFNAPIVYCFAYGSGVFPQEDNGRSITDAEFRAVHPKPPPSLVKSQKGAPKVLDFVFGVTHTEHWHSINMKQHRDHYSGLASLGSGAVSRVQDWGAGVYYHPYIEVNGMLIKYGVTSIDNLVNDLSSWDSLYLAGRLQKPVKILRDHPRVRLANQHNLIAAIRTAMLLLPPEFSEVDLYSTIAGLSYLGDPRMSLPTENKSKVSNIVDNNIVHFRRLYAPLVKTLPNIAFTSPCRLDDEEWILNPKANHTIQQDMDPMKRANLVRRLPKTFRSRLYFQYQKKFALPRGEFMKMIQASSRDDDSTAIKKRQGGEFERRIAADDPKQLQEIVRRVIQQTVNWPSTTQSLKGLLTGGWRRSWRYMSEKIAKYRKGQQKSAEAKSETPKQEAPEAEKSTEKAK
jgi:translocator assembly and maintenance protein 41